MDLKELHESRKKLGNASRERKRAYIDSSTGLFDEQYTCTRNCPVCGANHELEIFQVRGGRYVKCVECGMIYLNPVFTDSALEQFYRENHVVQSQIVEEDSAFYTQLYEKGLQQIVSETGRVGKLLDIGCSSGCFMEVARRLNWIALGVELNKAEAVLAEKKGFMIYGSLQQFSKRGEKVDAVSMWDVFEHIKDGRSFIMEARDILADGGVIFLQIPVADSLAARIMHEHCNMFDGMEHVNIYGKKTIEDLADACGMNVVAYSTVISELFVLHNYLAYEDPYSGSFTERGGLFGYMDERKILSSGLGYKAQVVLRRK